MQIKPMSTPTHEQLVKVTDPRAELIGFIAIHSTKLGPAAGGLRMRPYESEAEAIEDVLRLSRGMTYKNAAAELPLGGGKAVIMGDPRQKTPAQLQAFGRGVEALDGRYWTAEDMGMTPADMGVLAQETRFVAGLADGPYASGDPSPITARGIFNAIRTTARHQFGADNLAGMHVAVQGLGHVGMHLCALLHGAGVRLSVTDMVNASVAEAVDTFDAHPVAPSDILTTQADILAPCAIGGILNEQTIPQLRVNAIAGGANNQLATADDGTRLHARGILYAPDFVANGGGIINVATEILRIKAREAFVADKLAALDATMDSIHTRAIRADVSPNDVAEQIVDEMLRPDAA